MACQKRRYAVASLATLPWYERCSAGSLRISWPRFVVTGAVTACAALAAATLGLPIAG